MPARDEYSEVEVVPRIALHLPLELPLPDGFDVARPETWPPVDGRLEYVQGRLEFLPPCGEDQRHTTADVVYELGSWSRNQPGFLVGANEAGILFGGEMRAVDGGVWRAADLGARDPGVARVAPILAVEVAGRDDTVEMLIEKSRWYLDRGVEVVWVLDPKSGSVRVITRAQTVELHPGERLPPHPALPGLEPRVDDLFRQVLSRR